MGRIIVLALLLAIMLGLRALSGEGTGAHHALILAAIGFVVMASFAAAELGSLLTLPRVSGYLAAGLLLGPSLGNILSTGVVEDMTMFNTLALGLIATGAGLELDLKALKALWRTLATTVGAKVVLSGGAVAGGFVLVETLYAPLGLATPVERAVVGMVLGALSVGTSPAIALAVINETDARGRLADLTLGAAVVKDLVLVVLLAVCLAVGTSALGIAQGEGNLLGTLATELGGSVALGAALGGLIIAYVRFVREEMLLFVAGLVLAAAELSRALHLDLLLVFIAAGFVVRNFSQVWEEVLHAIETVALPVFVVFFTIAGARIDLDATIRLLPIALVLAGLRAGAFFAAGRLGARVGGEGREVRRLAWLAYLPQAGVTLGLLGIAVEALAPVGKALSDIGIACVAINLAIGPVTMRRALQAATRSATREDSDAPEEAAEVAPNDEPSAPPSRRPRPNIDTGHGALDGVLRALERQLQDLTSATVRDAVRPHVQATTRELAEVMAVEDARALTQQVHVYARRGRGRELGEQAAAAALLLRERSLSLLEELPPIVTVPFSPELIAPRTGDSIRLRLSKLRWRVRHRLTRGEPERRIPLRTAARVAMAQRLHGLCERLARALCASQSRVLLELERCVDGQLDSTQLADAITQHLDDLTASFQADASVAIDAGLHDLLAITADVASPTRPLASLRYSEVEPEVRARGARLEEAAEAWSAALDAAEQRLQHHTALARLRHGSEAALDAYVLLPLADAAEALEPVIADTRAHLESALERVRDSRARDPLPALITDLTVTGTRHEEAADARADLFHAAPALLAIARELRSLVDAVPAELRVVAGSAPLHAYAQPEEAPLRGVHLRSDAHRELIAEFIPVLDIETRSAAAAVQDLDARLGEVLDVALSAMQAAVDDPTLELASVEAALERAIAGLLHGRDHTRKQLVSAHDAISAAFQQAFDRLAPGEAASLDVRAAGLALTRPIARALRHAAERARTGVTRLRHTWQELMGTELARRLRNPLATPRDLRELFSRDIAAAVPASYARLFRLEPEQDLRLCIGRDAELAVLVDGQARWREGLSSSALIVGAPGSGRTTLLNVAQAEITASRMLRPDAARSRRQRGLIRSLAYELGRSGSRRELGEALRSEPTAVLVDDLEHWFNPDAAGLARLRSFLDLVRSTREEVYWIVCVTQEALELFDEVLRIPDVFGDVVRLQPFSPAELRRAIEIRHALSGLELVFPSRPGRSLERLLQKRRGELFFRALHALSAGNPSAALALWQNSIRVDEQSVTALLDRLLAQRLPTLPMFDAATVGVLVELLRFGPMTASRLAASLGTPVPEVRRIAVRLEDLGLVGPSPGKEVTLAPAWRAVLSERLPAHVEWR